MRMLTAVVALVLPIAASAQAIEKMKITDAELSCGQLYSEIGDMDRIIGVTKDSRDTSANTSTAVTVAQQAGGHAVHAAAVAGNYGAAAGLAQAMPFVGLFGSVAKGVADTQERASAERLADAKGRKEHLTGLFINKGCKASELQAQEKPATPAN